MKRLYKALFEKGKISRLLLVMGLFALSSASFAQNAEIFGVIRDATNNELLPGATVTIEGTSIGTITDLDGLFRLSNLTPGNYTISFSYVGFLTEKIDIVLGDGEKKQLDMQMAFDAVSLGEVVVTAQILGQAKALNQQLNSDALVSVVSSDKIEELPDANAAEAIGRLPGIAVQRSGGEANKVMVRGLSPNLTNVTINGIKVPPTSNSIDGSDRSVDLSMISPELLSSIEVFKAPTADMDGEAIGGTVNLGIAKALMKPVAKVRVSGGVNSDFKSSTNYKASFDLSKRFFDSKLGVLVQGNYENTNRSEQRIDQTWNKDMVDREDENQWVIATAILEQDIRSINRQGGNSTLDYKYGSGFILAQGLYSERNGETEVNYNRMDYGTNDRYRPKHSKSKQYTYQGTLNGQQRIRSLSIDWVVSRSHTTNDNFYDVRLDMIDREGSEPTNEYNDDFEVYNLNQLLGTRSTSSDPHVEVYSVEPELSNQNYTTAGLDFKLDYSLSDRLAGFLKFGGKYQKTDREFSHGFSNVSDYYLTPTVVDEAVTDMEPYNLILHPLGISMENFYDTKQEIPILNTGYSIFPEISMDKMDLWHEHQQENLRLDMNRVHRNYTLTESVTAAYAMAKINIEKWFTFIPGVRYEYSNNEYNSFYSTIDQSVQGTIGQGEVIDSTTTQKYGVFLPSFHVKIKPLDWFDLRLSAVKTLARPSYSMLVPSTWVNIRTAVIEKTNPNLKHSEAWSYDATASFFSNKYGLFSVAGFYKHFDNYFTEVNYDLYDYDAAALGYPNTGFNVSEDFMNFDNSEVYGFELDLQLKFPYLPAPFNGIVFSTNFTRLWSKTYQPKFAPKEIVYVGREAIEIIDTVGTIVESLMPDQVPQSFNASIGYDYKGFSFRVSAIYQAHSLQALSTVSGQYADRYKYYTDDFLRFDASIKQKIGKHLSLTANLANFTSETEGRYQYISKVTRTRYYGATFDLGLQYIF